MPRPPIRINPFPARRESPLWRRIVNLAAAIIVLPIALAVVLLVIVLLPVLVLCSTLRDSIFGIKRPRGRKEMKPRCYWPASEQTIPSEHFGELHVTRSGQWVKATFPAFARFGRRYAESAAWEDPPPDLPPPGEVSVMLGYPVMPGMPGYGDVTARPSDMAGYAELYNWLQRHQEAIAEEIEQQLPDPTSFLRRRNDEEAIPVADRFRISSVVLECGNTTAGHLVHLWVDQTWDPEHAWRAEISGIRDDGFFDLDFGTM